jgi:hypothetical protein
MRNPSAFHLRNVGRPVVQDSRRSQSQKEKKDRDVPNGQENLDVLAGHLAMHLDRIVTALSAFSTDPEMDARCIKNCFQYGLLETVYPSLALLTCSLFNDQVATEGFGNDVFFAELSVIRFSVARIPGPEVSGFWAGDRRLPTTMPPCYFATAVTDVPGQETFR